MAEGAPAGVGAAVEEDAAQRRSELRTLARGGTLNVVGMVLGGVLGFALVVVVTRGLGPEGTGVFMAAVALFTILSNVTELGADTGLVRTIARYRTLERVADVRQLLSVALWPVLLTGALAAALVLVLAPQLARVFVDEAHQVEGVDYLRLLAPFLALSAASTVVLSGSRGFGTMAPFVFVENMGKPAARVLFVLAAVLLGLGNAAIAFGWALPIAAGFLIGVIVVFQRVHALEVEAGVVERHVVPTRAVASEFWRFAGPRGFAGAFQVAVVWLDILLVSSMRTAGEAGVYSAASRLVMMGTFALQAVRLAIAPQLSSLLAEHRRERAEELYQVATWWLMAVSWPLFLMLAVFAPTVLGIFGPSFTSGQHALLILSLAMLVNLGTGNVTVVLLMGGKSSWNLLNTICSVALNVGLNLVLIPRMGIEGAAIAWTASIVFDNLAALLEVRFLLGLRPFGAGYVRVALGSVACFGAVGLGLRTALGSSALVLLLAVVVSAALYLPLLWRSRNALHLSIVREAFARRGGGGRANVVGDTPSAVRRFVPRSARRVAREGVRRFAVATSARRSLPDFVIVGAKRGGTTSLFDYLLHHPHVSPLFPAAQRVKGVRFFDLNYHKGEVWYRSFFPTEGRRGRMRRRLGGPYVAGEASPYYLFHPHAPERAGRTIPDAKLIAVLRNPVDRAYSHYRERVRHGVEPLTFEEAIDAEAERMRGELDRLLAEDRYYSFAHENYTYVAQGIYADMLEAWLERFPRERILVLRSEDMFGDPSDLFRRIQEFLGLPVVDLQRYGRLNYHPGSGMAPETRRRLLELFEPHNRRLAELVGFDLWDER